MCTHDIKHRPHSSSTETLAAKSDMTQTSVPAFTTDCNVEELLSENTHWAAHSPSAVSESPPGVCCAPHLKLLPLWRFRAGGINRGSGVPVSMHKNMCTNQPMMVISFTACLDANPSHKHNTTPPHLAHEDVVLAEISMH
jgi:hypothetical protein